MSSEAVQLIEVSPRDGLQNEKVHLSTDRKVGLVTDLVASGATRIELTSFVSPTVVPQLADADAVVDRVARLDLEASLIALVLNLRGAQRALAHDRIDEVNLVVPVTDSFGRANQGTSTSESLTFVDPIADLVGQAGKYFSVTLAVAFGCPYEGIVSLDRVRRVLDRVVDCGPDEVALADTLGCAVPAQVSAAFQAAGQLTGLPLRAHFHDTRRTGLANVWSALAQGVRRFDASVGGVGGCPFAPGAAGNVATEDVIWMLDRSGAATGLDPVKLAGVGMELCHDLGTRPRSGVGTSDVFPSTESLPRSKSR